MRQPSTTSGIPTKGLRAPAVCLGLLLALVLTLVSVGTAGAATIKVTNTHDSGPGSLRRAIDRANSHPGFDRIPIKATGTIALHGSLPDLTTDLAIKGPGARKLEVAGAQRGSHKRFPIFNIFSSPRAPGASPVSVRVSGVSILRGSPGILNHRGRLTVSRSALRHNVKGISNGGGLTMSRSTVSGNGNAITNHAFLTVSGSTISANGAGIQNFGGHATVSRSTLSGNHSNYHQSLHGLGGGIQNDGGTLTVSQSTLSGNSGAIANLLSGTITVSQSTLSANSALAQGGAIYDQPNSSPITILRSTIVANSPGGHDCTGGPVTSQGHNLVDDGTCGLTAQGDQPNTEPLLRPLGDYGGFTETFKLRPSSPAIDAGFAAGATTDQRGLPRAIDYPGVPTATGGDNSDVGAFELQRSTGG